MAEEGVSLTLVTGQVFVARRPRQRSLRIRLASTATQGGPVTVSVPVHAEMPAGGDEKTMDDRQTRQAAGNRREWVMYAGRPHPKPPDPRERWRREWITSGRPV
jgi:hypothetical protein